MRKSTKNADELTASSSSLTAIPVKVEDEDPELPKSVKVNGNKIIITQISPFQEDQNLFGDYDIVKSQIRIVTKKNRDFNWSILFHEIMHGIDQGYYPADILLESQNNILSQRLLDAQSESNFCLNPKIINDPDNPDNACFVNKDGKVMTKPCKFTIASTDVSVVFASSEDMDFSFGYHNYNRFLKQIKIPKINHPDGEQLMQTALIHGFVDAVDDIEQLGIPSEKKKFLGQHIYQFLKDNEICYKRPADDGLK